MAHTKARMLHAPPADETVEDLPHCEYEVARTFENGMYHLSINSLTDLSENALGSYPLFDYEDKQKSDKRRSLLDYIDDVLNIMAAAPDIRLLRITCGRLTGFLDITAMAAAPTLGFSELPMGSLQAFLNMIKAT
ncbi:uncharacterized protein BDV14DRAFT_202323 [Aspergillus stella-maris]|uniref:uncharacterized protein n=1 Tax=Aspergillus stella-maris TaxID=1810926 RepID=UPI003CCD5735